MGWGGGGVREKHPAVARSHSVLETPADRSDTRSRQPRQYTASYAASSQIEVERVRGRDLSCQGVVQGMGDLLRVGFSFWHCCGVVYGRWVFLSVQATFVVMHGIIT